MTPRMIRRSSRRSRLTLAALGCLVLAVGLPLSSMAVLTAQQLSPEQEVRHFIARFVTLWNTADLKTLVASFAPRASLYTPSGHAKSRDEIEQFLKMKQAELFLGREMSVEIRKIQFDSRHHADVETDFLLDGYSAMGFGSLPPGTLSFVLHQYNGRWHIEQAVMQR